MESQRTEESGGTSGNITMERYTRLVHLAVQYMSDAEQCAKIGCFHPACVMAGAGAEAGILAHACLFAPEIKAAGQWQGTRDAPFDWMFERLIQLAIAMKWLPASRAAIPNEDAVDKLTGEVGDAVRFVQYTRNLAVHPGKHASEMTWLEIGQREFDLVYGISRMVFDHLYEFMNDDPGRPALIQPG